MPCDKSQRDKNRTAAEYRKKNRVVYRAVREKRQKSEVAPDNSRGTE